VYCPSTIDTNTIVEFTDEISVDLSSLPGTSLKKAFELIRNSLIKNKEKEKTIILLSDGETHAPVDNNDLEWFTKNKIKIYAIALGSEEGAKIPISENNKTIEYKKDSSGKEIITKRNTELLKNISSKTNALFIENEKQLPALISELNQLKKENKEIKQKVIKEELYYYFLIPALFLFLMELLVLERKDVFI
jgi:Ca-activated chloride channel family protein